MSVSPQSLATAAVSLRQGLFTEPGAQELARQASPWHLGTHLSLGLQTLAAIHWLYPLSHVLTPTPHTLLSFFLLKVAPTSTPTWWTCLTCHRETDLFRFYQHSLTPSSNNAGNIPVTQRQATNPGSSRARPSWALKTSSLSILQCYLLSLWEIHNSKYALEFPIFIEI